MNVGAVTSFACSCLLSCFAATVYRHMLEIRAVQSAIEFFFVGTKCNDVIFNYVIIEISSSGNPSVRTTGKAE